MTPIPLVLFEEHHEAYLLWHIAIQRGWIERCGNTLLHVDAHSDMVLPVLRSPLPEHRDLSAVRQFTYTTLDIATFILPAVYERIFNRVVYMRSEHPVSALGWRHLEVALGPDEHMTLRTRTGSVFEQPEAARLLDYARITPQVPVDTDQPIILDIDLDFFCTNENPCPAINEVETTQAVYDEMHRNPYHVLRLIPRLNVAVLQRDTRYYLKFYDMLATRDTPQEQQAVIHCRMDAFIEGLRSSSVRPVLISLCRSYYSGYTPAAWVEYIQDLALAKLAELYPLGRMRLEDLFSQGNA